jgi:hypothetical protein
MIIPFDHLPVPLSPIRNVGPGSPATSQRSPPRDLSSELGEVDPKQRERPEAFPGGHVAECRQQPSRAHSGAGVPV